MANRIEKTLLKANSHGNYVECYAKVPVSSTRVCGFVVGYRTGANPTCVIATPSGELAKFLVSDITTANILVEKQIPLATALIAARDNQLRLRITWREYERGPQKENSGYVDSLDVPVDADKKPSGYVRLLDDQNDCPMVIFLAQIKEVQCIKIVPTGLSY